MAHKTLIDGTAHELTRGVSLVGGTSYEIRKGQTLVGGTSYDISLGKKIGELPVGSSVFLDYGDAYGNPERTKFIVVHQGNPDPAVYDVSCDGTWLLKAYTNQLVSFRQDPSTVDTRNNNTYSMSSVHSLLNDYFYNKFGDDVKAAIKEVKIPYYIAHNGLTGDETAKVFLLSATEVGFTQTDNAKIPLEGAKLDYFLAGDTAEARERRIAYADAEGEAENRYTRQWWLRSPYMGTRDEAWTVYHGGFCSEQTVTEDFNLRQAFIMSPDFEVKDYKV